MDEEKYIKSRLDFINRNSIYGLSVDEETLKQISKELFKDCSTNKKSVSEFISRRRTYNNTKKMKKKYNESYTLYTETSNGICYDMNPPSLYEVYNDVNEIMNILSKLTPKEREEILYIAKKYTNKKDIKTITMFNMPCEVYHADTIRIASSYPVDNNTKYVKFIKISETDMEN